MIRRLAWIKAIQSKNKYENKYKRKRKRTSKKDKLTKAVEKIEKRAKTHNSSMISKSYPVLRYDSSLQIRDSLYTHESEANDIPPAPAYPYKPLQKRTSNIENYMAEKYLDKMYLDKMFLKNLKKCDGVKSPNTKGTKTIMKMAQDGYKTLCYKQVKYSFIRPEI